MNKDDLILWIDVEVNDPDPEIGELLEIGVIVTDISGNEIGNEYHALFKTEIGEILAATNDEVLKMHEESGLWKDLWLSDTTTLEKADEELGLMMKSIMEEYPRSRFYFGGNSITLDRSFIRLFLPKFYDKLSFRSIDVTSISLAVQGNSEIDGYRKTTRHRALEDAKDSLREYRHYLEKLELN